MFTESTHIVAVKPSGNVYCYQAVEELNIKPKNWKCVRAQRAAWRTTVLTRHLCRDLLTDEPFKRADIVVLQDPLNLSGRELAQFHHVAHELRADDGAPVRAGGVNAGASGDMARALQHLDTDAARDGARQRTGSARVCAAAACAALRHALRTAPGTLHAARCMHNNNVHPC